MSGSHAHDDHGFAHTMSPQMLVGIWAALIALTGITVWTANMHLAPFDLVIAIIIATVKALLVALFFMHLAYDRPFNGLVFMLSFVFAGVFIVFAMFDTGRNQPVIAQLNEEDPDFVKETGWREEVAEMATQAELDRLRGILDGSVVVDHGHGDEHAEEGGGEDAAH